MITSQYEDAIILEALYNYMLELPGGFTNPDFPTIISILNRIVMKKEKQNDIQ